MKPQNYLLIGCFVETSIYNPNNGTQYASVMDLLYVFPGHTERRKMCNNRFIENIVREGKTPKNVSELIHKEGRGVEEGKRIKEPKEVRRGYESRQVVASRLKR